jgi:GT2 family glycosyltransferase
MTPTAPAVFVSIVTFNSERFVAVALKAVLTSEGYRIGQNLEVMVVDNASDDATVDRVCEVSDAITVVQSAVNLGFCGGHNLAAAAFLESRCDYFLVLNPDARLAPTALSQMCKPFAERESVGAVSPLLIRGDDNLQPFDPSIVDAAGMKLTTTLRHFDIGSGEIERAEFREPGYVFGGTGACLFLSRECVQDIAFRGTSHESDVREVYPQIMDGLEKRVQLFDEGFFAFRDDAELCWRMQRLGWNVWYEPEACCYHHRHVLPERRADLSATLNALGVKNRFLLQWNHFSLRGYAAAVLPGFVVRNLLVLLAVFLKERSSLHGLKEAWKLRRRAQERYRMVAKRARVSEEKVSRWMSKEKESVGVRNEI